MHAFPPQSNKSGLLVTFLALSGMVCQTEVAESGLSESRLLYSVASALENNVLWLGTITLCFKAAPVEP